MQRVRPTQNGGQRFDRGSGDIVVRLLRGERHPGRLGVETQPLRARITGAIGIPHPARPDPPGCTEFRDLLEEVDVRIEEERQTRGEPVDVHPAGQTQFDITETVRQRVGQFLRGRRTGLPDVIAGHRKRFVVGHLLGAELHQVADQPQVRFRREDPFLLRDVFLEDVGLQRAVEVDRSHAPCRSAATRYMQNTGTAGPEIVIDVVTLPRSIPSNKVSMSAAESTATPQCPTSPSDRGSSESRPIRVGMSKATLSPCPPWSRISLYRSLVSTALPKPANWRIVHGFPRYPVACKPRVNGNSPGQPIRSKSAMTSPSAGP